MTALKLLIAEDLPDDAELLVRHLRRAGYELTWSRVETEAAFLDGLRANPDIIISDFSMPEFSGIRALELLRDSGQDIPLILVSGEVGEETAVEAMRLGAVDFLVKERTARLPAALERALQQAADRREHRRMATALAQSESRLRAIIETMPECVKVVEPDGSVRLMNPAGLGMLQVESLEELRKHSLLQFLAPAYHDAYLRHHERVMNGETCRLEFEIIGLLGYSRFAETRASPLRTEDGRIEGVLAITRDLTDRRRHELQIQQQLDELQRWRSATLGREERVLALKAEVNELLASQGLPPRYHSAIREEDKVGS